MAITKLSELPVDIYTDAKTAQGARLDINAHLENMAARGDITGDLLPSPEERRAKHGKNVSALQFIFAKAGINVRGKKASPAGVFFRKDSSNYIQGAEVLFPAFCAAIYSDWMNKPNMAAVDNSFFSEPSAPGDLIFPTVLLDVFRDFALKDRRALLKLMLSDIVSFTTGIDSDSYKAGYIAYNSEADLEPGRVSEGADLPLYDMTTGTNIIRLYKYGGAVRASYEVLRRQKLNRVVRTIQGIARREEWRKIRAALTVALNGDGNSNPALNTNSGATSWDLPDFDDWSIDTAYDYDEEISIVATDKAEAKSIVALKQPAANKALTPDQVGMYGPGDLRLPTGQTMKLAPSGSVLQGATKLLGWNQLNGLEQVVENGSLISEADRFVRNQTEIFTLSENAGFAKVDPTSFHTLTRSA
jgi:hypothetical protein